MKRWNVLIEYKKEYPEQQPSSSFQIEEIEELQGILEYGAPFFTIEKITITYNHEDSCKPSPST